MGVLLVPATKTFGGTDVFDGHGVFPKKTALIRAVVQFKPLLVVVDDGTDALTFVKKIESLVDVVQAHVVRDEVV